jgi:hypothetical protein
MVVPLCEAAGCLEHALWSCLSIAGSNRPPIAADCRRQQNHTSGSGRCCFTGSRPSLLRTAAHGAPGALCPLLGNVPFARSGPQSQTGWMRCCLVRLGSAPFKLRPWQHAGSLHLRPSLRPSPAPAVAKTKHANRRLRLCLQVVYPHESSNGPVRCPSPAGYPGQGGLRL